MKKKLLLVCFFVFALFAYSQKTSSFKKILNDKFDYSKSKKASLPLEYNLYEFNYSTFLSDLQNAPQRNSNSTSQTKVLFPDEKGELSEYLIYEASVFQETLQQSYPEIRSYVGYNVNDKSTQIRFSISPYNGLSAIIRSTKNKTTYIIDPISSDNKTIIFFDRKHKTDKNSFICTTEDVVKEFGPTINNENINKNADDGKLRVFELALSCTGEYATFHGGTIASVNAAYNTTMTRVNGIFEMDFNSTMVIINNNDNVIYLNASTDPYGSTDANYNSELQTTLNNVIGSANYDIGHLVSAIGNNGNAGCIGCICGTGKGSGFTTSTYPVSDTFDIDYVAHEMGHQYGGNHTFSFSTENNSVNVEPGSGITIMGYAGITGATDVADHSIAIFHAKSIEQITNNIKTKACDDEVITGNNVPVVNAGLDKILPIGTAFKLTGTATDADSSDVLTYCWEQIDDATTVGEAESYPAGDKANGANFRSFMPELIGTRYFPNILDHVNNGVAGNTWEIVPTITRTLSFRLTVRDNRLGGATNNSDDVLVTFNENYGPFEITSQNTTGINYEQGSTQTITWNVNNTTALTGSANVNIKLSTDGGQNFSIILASNIPNNGSANVIIPNVFAPFCRILIEPTNNIYYAINTHDFAIGYNVEKICEPYIRNLTSSNSIPQGSYAGWSINVPDNFVISDVNITTNITHGRRNQVYAFLRKQGTPNIDVDLFQGGSCSNLITNLNGTFDDESLNAPQCGTSNNFGSMQPLNSLNAFDGLNASGNWILAVADAVNDTRTGTLNSFTLELCYDQITETPIPCGQITTTWDGNSWSNGEPLRNVAVTFTGNYSSTKNIEACSVNITNEAQITFNEGHTLIVGGSVNVDSGSNLIIENNAALRQIDDTANTGTITVKRNSTPMIRLDYTAWSSPVANQNLLAFSPNTVTTRFYEYLYTGNTTATAYQSVNPVTTSFEAGKGYVIRVANNWSSTIAAPYLGVFNGSPFNGNVSEPIGVGYNVIGNPYASPIDANLFLQDNPSISALYFWTHTVPASGSTYPSNNFASYTLLGGVASANGSPQPNGYIQVGQGFYVQRQGTSSEALFKNSQRVNASASTQFFKTSNTTQLSNVNDDKHRIWLNFNNEIQSNNQVLIGYMNNATNNIDVGIDALLLDESSSVLYSLVNNEKYVIEGRAFPFVTNDVVPLGYKAINSGNYTISLHYFDGVFSDQNIYLKDNLLNNIHDLKQSSYVFNTSIGEFNNRFELIYENGVLQNSNFINENNILLYADKETIFINTNSDNMRSVEIYDVLGRTLYVKELNNNYLECSSLLKTQQALFVKIKLENGQIVTKKLIY